MSQSGSRSGRKARVADAIRDTLAEMIAREVKDPRVAAAGLVSITRVEMNVDLSVANVYVSIYGRSPDGSRGGDDRAAAKAVEGLQAAAGFLRGPLGRKLRIRPPELRFVHDTGLEFGMKLTEIVREDEAKKRVEGEGQGQGQGEGDSDE